ncbi:HU family DNA-binding protein [Methylophilus sp. DW102]|uniref:HU family DNA-binding protein n=1 Tax=Methylophilus sp. DW102 TaxID=3095607 RepID=UPI0030904F17|nr:HU family DNA-binding protein [Methylophilus sp. DW102]
MNKQQLVEAVSLLANTSKADTTKVLDALVPVITDTLKNGDEVRLHGLGTLKVKLRKGRTGRNPRTGQPIEIAAKKVVVISVFPSLEDAVNA